MAGRANKKRDDSNEGLVIIYNMMANRSVPIVFILVSSLIIANISCDQVGSANELDLVPVAATNEAQGGLAESAGLSMPALAGPATAKYDPLSMLREIYLDHNSKVITLLSSPTSSGSSSNSVQKFHPNGRYGRRSVDNLADAPGAHTELAKLRFGDGDESDSQLGSLLRSSAWNDDGPDTLASAAAAKQPMRGLSWLLNHSGRNSNGSGKQLLNNPRHRQPEQGAANGTSKRELDNSFASYRQELNKLLKCNYSGVSNLFWCNS